MNNQTRCATDYPEGDLNLILIEPDRWVRFQEEDEPDLDGNRDLCLTPLGAPVELDLLGANY